MENSDDIAQQALNFIDIAQRFEENGDYSKAIENYEAAANTLKNSGYLLERVADIYGRIEDLQEMIRQEKMYQQQQFSSDIEKAQDQAFSILDMADKYEKDGQFDDAIEQYSKAIELLSNAGWADNQLQNLREKIVVITDLKKQREAVPHIDKADDGITPQVVDAFGTKVSTDKAQALKQYQERKQREEAIEKKAFDLIDQAKLHERNRNLKEAIISYEKSVELLNSIGWIDQTASIRTIIEGLINEQANLDRLKSEQSVITDEIAKKGVSKVKEYEQRIKNEEEIQVKAFDLIDLGKKMEAERKYDLAIENLEEAIRLLKSINWDSYIQPINNIMVNIKDKMKKDEELHLIKQKREKEVESLQDTLYVKEQDQFIQSSRELEQKRYEYEQKKKQEQKNEEKLFEILDDADNLLKEDSDYDGAIAEYNKAIEFIDTLGPGWESYKTSISSTISSINTIKESQLKKEMGDQTKATKQKMVELEYHHQIAEQLKRERILLEKKEFEYKARENEREFREKRKDLAFKQLERAQDYVHRGDFDNAIIAYQNVGNIFAAIQWTEELPIIEDAIKELEIQKQEFQKIKEKQMSSSLERLKKEQEFQERIANELQKERVKLKQREIKLKEQEKELERREQRKEDAFKIMRDAQTRVEKGEYDEAVDLYEKAIRILAEIQWHEEIELIQNSILEIQNKKRETDLKKIKVLQSKLDQEKQERNFQLQVSREMRSEREKLKQKQIKLREREEEVKFREKRREEAFKIIEEAQVYLTMGDYEKSLEAYREVANIFAQIQWKEEIPIIQQAISKVESKRKEAELWKQKIAEEEIKKEAEYKKFIEHIRKQREVERIKTEKQKELFEKEKEISTINKEKENQALQLIDKADDLIKQEDYDKAIDNYEQAIQILIDIGWAGSYLNLLKETLYSIETRKKEKEKKRQLHEEQRQKQKKLESQFQEKIRKEMAREKERLMAKRIELKQRENLVIEREKLKEEAFEIMDVAEDLLNQGQYEQSIKNYLQAELILNEIQFPTDVIKEMIKKIREKQRDKELEKQKTLERRMLREKEEREFLQKISEAVKMEEERLKLKEIEIKQKVERQLYFENRRNQAFQLLEQAESFLNNGEYDKSLEKYEEAESILIDIGYSTDTLSNMIIKVKEKRRDQDLMRQKLIEEQIIKEREEKEFQARISDLVKQEKKKLRKKELVYIQKEEEREYQENQRERAFQFLDSAQKNVISGEFDSALIEYQKARMIFAEINWESELHLIDSAIAELEEKKRARLEYNQKEAEKQVLIEKEERAFQDLISKQLREERARVKQIEINARMEQQQLVVLEKKKEEAFNRLDEAYSQMQAGDYERAIQTYKETELLFSEMNWFDEIGLIRNAIIETQRKQREEEIKQQRELQIKLEEERQEREFQVQIAKEMENQQKMLNKRQILIQEQETKLKDFEQKRVLAFNLIDQAHDSLNRNEFDEAIDTYQEVARIFAQIQWNEEIPFIREAISDVEQKRKESQLSKQRALMKELETQKAEEDFIRQIKLERLKEKAISDRKVQDLKKLEVSSKQNLASQQKAFDLVEQGDLSLRERNFNLAISQYQGAIKILSDIGWSEGYLNLINESVERIKEKAREEEQKSHYERDLLEKRVQEQKQFELMISEDLKQQEERFRRKEIQLEEMEEIRKQHEKRKEDAFVVMEEAENHLAQGQYEKSKELYSQAELILSEINFPIDSVKEMMANIDEKIREKRLREQVALERQIKKEEEDRQFQEKLIENMRFKQEQLKSKQIKLQKRDDLIKYMEGRKEEAFHLLDIAEGYLSKGSYDLALEQYHKAELILSEIQFPTDSLRESITKILEIKKQKDLEDQKKMELEIKKEMDNIEFQKQVSESLHREKSRLKMKQIKVQRQEELKKLSEEKKNQAFKMLEEAEKLTNESKFDLAIGKYRKSMLLLNEIQYPTDPIEGMINKVNQLKRKQEMERELRYQREIEKLEEEKQLQEIIKERRRQEEDRKATQERIREERERIIRDQMSSREAAYSLLEEGSTYLQSLQPDYDKAIEFYLQARDILSEKVGWEPEINNLNRLISDLQSERVQFIEKKKGEEQLRVKRQQEYEEFQDDLRKRQQEFEIQKKMQQDKFRQLQFKKQQVEEIKSEGLRLIDEGKFHVSQYQFEEGYDSFELAIQKFDQIGWSDQAKYIRKEIENTKKYQKRLLKEAKKTQKIHEDLERKRIIEKRRKEEQEKEMKKSMGEVKELAGDVAKMIKEQRKQHEKVKELEKKRIEQEAKKFRKGMTKLLKLKQDLLKELDESTERVSKKKEELQLEKDKKKADEVKKMLKELSKKKN